MTHTVCQPCYDCKYTDCCVVCPVECFYQDDMMLYIDPVDCIDCEACVPECPVEAIFAEANVPAQWTDWTAMNAEQFRRPQGERRPHHRKTGRQGRAGVQEEVMLPFRLAATRSGVRRVSCATARDTLLRSAPRRG